MKIIKKLYQGFQRLTNLIHSYLFSTPYIIVDEDIGQKVVTIKRESIDASFFPPIFEHTRGGKINFIYPELVLRNFKSATVYHGSDFITTGKVVFWKKFFIPQWNKIIPSDEFMFRRVKNNLFIDKPKRLLKVDVGFNMLGVHAHIWAHFLLQHLPKLMCLKSLSDAEKQFTIIHPSYKDEQVKYLFKYFAGLYPNVSFLEVACGQAVFCNNLYHLNNTSQISDHATYISPSDIVIPRFVIDLLKNNLNLFLESEALESKKERKDIAVKIYIGRSGQRGLVNSKEVENFFVSKGFEIIFPEQFSTVEKFRLFRHADIIVGPSSSGFTNMIFCKPGTKILLFSNFQRLVDAFPFYKYFGINLLVLNGVDEDQTIHSSYKISIKKVIRAYDLLLSSSN